MCGSQDVSQIQQTSGVGEIQSRYPGQLIHSHVCDPMAESIGGSKFFFFHQLFFQMGQNVLLERKERGNSEV